MTTFRAAVPKPWSTRWRRRFEGKSRTLSAGLLAGIGDLIGIDDAGAAILIFDRMSDAELEAARSWLVTAPGYRAALERLGQGRG
jgi:hypothetical protein